MNEPSDHGTITYTMCHISIHTFRGMKMSGYVRGHESSNFRVGRGYENSNFRVGLVAKEAGMIQI